LVLNDTYMR